MYFVEIDSFCVPGVHVGVFEGQERAFRSYSVEINSFSVPGVRLGAFEGQERAFGILFRQNKFVFRLRGPFGSV